MNLVEIRDLDGPNLFDRQPVIKLEVALGSDDDRSDRVALDALRHAISALHQVAGLSSPTILTRDLDLPGHVAITYPWEWRQTALLIAKLAFDLRDGRAIDSEHRRTLRETLDRDRDRDDRPEWIRDSERTIPAVGVTGTNGKTTTCRLIAFIGRAAGYTVGMSGSAGVFIGDETIVEGDYSGPSGARRILQDPTVTLAVLETARGGILLRGLGYESNDISVLLNISADHLSLQGVERLETLAEVKSVVIQATRPDGVAILNADDSLVMAQRHQTTARVMLISQQSGNQTFQDHIEAGGVGLSRFESMINLHENGRVVDLIDVWRIPVTFGGAAPHMVENVLAAVAVAHSLGIDVDIIRAALREFQSDSRHNTGRLNIFRLDGRYVIVDYAHNESGLEMLVNFSRTLLPNSRVFVIVGTAGDRQDSILRGIGRIAGERADRVYVKENPKYLRGRTQDEINALVLAGIAESRAEERVAGIFPTEYDATFAAIADAGEDDVVAVMCVEDQRRILDELRTRGAQEWQPPV